MHNWYGVETEAEFRRQEWQRMVEADARATQAMSGRAVVRQAPLPRLFLARLRALSLPRLSFSPPLTPRRAAGYSAK